MISNHHKQCYLYVASNLFMRGMLMEFTYQDFILSAYEPNCAMTFSSFVNIEIGLPFSPILIFSLICPGCHSLKGLHKISGICLSLPEYFGYRYSSPCLSLIMCTQVQIPVFVQQECQTMNCSHTQPTFSNPKEN